MSVAVQVFKDVEVVEDKPLPSGFVSVKDAAKILSVTPETVRRWLADGQLKGEEVQSGARGRTGWRWVVTTASINHRRKLNKKGVPVG